MARSPLVVPILALFVFSVGFSSAQESEATLPGGDTSSLFWTQEERIVGFRNFDTIYETRPIDNGDDFLPLVNDRQDFSDLAYEVEAQPIRSINTSKHSSLLAC